MFNAICKGKRTLVVSVAVLAIFSCVFYLHTYANSIDSGMKVASIYGQGITQTEANLLAENYSLAVMLRLYDFLEILFSGPAMDEAAALSEFVLNQLIMRHEAKTLSVVVLDRQVAQAIGKCSLFQGDRGFDMAKYREFIQKQLVPRGMSGRLLENLFRDSLRATRIRQIVSGSVAVSDQEVLRTFRAYQKEDLQVIKFDLSRYAAQAHVTADQIRELYTKELKNLRTPEARSVRYAVFKMPEGKRLLKAKARISALQKVADQAAIFAETLAEGKVSFEKAARQAGAPVNTLPPFSDGLSNSSTFKELKRELPGLAYVTSQLTKEHPYSDVLEGIDKDRFYVLELLSVQPSRLLTLKEARPRLQEILRMQTASKLLYREGRAIVASIAKQLQEGKSFGEAAALEGIKSQKILGIVPSSRVPPKYSLYAETALLLSPGEISALQGSDDGGAYAVFLRRRETIRPAEYAKNKKELKAQLLKMKQTLLFREWMRSAREAAGVVHHTSQGTTVFPPMNPLIGKLLKDRSKGFP